MKTISKIILTITFLSFIVTINAQKIEQQGVSIALDMKPILQLEMTTPEQINFVFDEKSKYYKGIVKNAATILR